MSDHLKQRGLESRVHGVAPKKSIDLDKYKGQHIPTDWNIVGVTGDILMCEYADEHGESGEYVDRGGILVDAAMTKEMWRIGKIHLAGPGASEQAQPGTYIMFPNDRGIPITKFDGKNYIFINEERIFCFVEPKNKNIDVT